MDIKSPENLMPKKIFQNFLIAKQNEKLNDSSFIVKLFEKIGFVQA